MLHGTRRTAAALGAVVLLTPVLAACGGGGDDKSDTDVAGVSLSGGVGKSIKASWPEKFSGKKSSKATTVVKGSGDEIAKDDTVSTYVWIGSGKSKKTVYDDYKNGASEPIPAGQVSGVLGSLFDGATYGSRRAAVTTGSDLFGSPSGNPQLGVGGSDPVVIVVDLVKKAPVSPTPSSDKVQTAPASEQPKVVEKGGKPSGLDFAGVDEPALDTPVQRVVLKQGNGAAVKATDTITVNYLGSTYKGTTPFDESYTKQPLSQPLSGLIKGWAIGLTGVKVGSRVLLQIPPAYGYGAQGSPPTIPANATLWFVIDVTGTK
ncbi:peptidylprolyl isomerase [Marmoricola endophyticus]|uniref:Peptidyl-prolyl cis-trans isomerase n=1 Tax=Marmoricola endophyticus TaxID=2040280 RepID=A0A917BRD5_9ACTN|nr:FKBP-type peptidyl-prolyl cis-trans isomerase [Marmoricola endophyticus]GGF54653.1 peptidylprolyl isomerase [Marmoricola endophyticus]